MMKKAEVEVEGGRRMLEVGRIRLEGVRCEDGGTTEEAPEFYSGLNTRPLSLSP